MDILSRASSFKAIVQCKVWSERHSLLMTGGVLASRIYKVKLRQRVLIPTPIFEQFTCEDRSPGDRFWTECRGIISIPYELNKSKVPDIPVLDRYFEFSLYTLIYIIFVSATQCCSVFQSSVKLVARESRFDPRHSKTLNAYLWNYLYNSFGV